MKKDVSSNTERGALGPFSDRSFGLSDPWFEEFMQPHRWLNNFMGNEIFTPFRPFQSDVRLLAPAIDIDESESAFIVTADLPGVKKEDLKIDHSGNRLTISAERKYDSIEGRKNERRERFHGTYQRSFTLPNGVDAEKIEASFEGGVLNIQIPKAEKSRPRRIAVSDKNRILNEADRRTSEVNKAADEKH